MIPISPVVRVSTGSIPVSLNRLGIEGEDNSSNLCNPLFRIHNNSINMNSETLHDKRSSSTRESKITSKM